MANRMGKWWQRTFPPVYKSVQCVSYAVGLSVNLVFSCGAVCAGIESVVAQAIPGWATVV
jgi:hypothetical protein